MSLHRRPSLVAVALLVFMAVVVSGCSSSATPNASATTPSGKLSIVAGENFWGSLASQLVGQVGRVTSVVTDPNADPHSYETSSDDARAFATADYAVINGAGYDSWADKLLSGNPNGRRKVLTVADLLGKKDGDNPHFWYQPDYVTRVIDRIEADLKALDPSDSAYFDTQRRAVDSAFAPVHAHLQAIRSAYAGTPLAATESIFEYLGANLGLRGISPPEFIRAVAEGNDPPAPSVAQFQDQISRREAKVLVYNLQTSTVVTTNLKQMAAQAHIPTVAVTETIQPPEAAYQQWFDAELVQLQNALAGR